ncbi:histidine--tRNA ligase [Anaerotignum sp. MSJ-24]|uniref:histidine--tRNA ligase n=1 Tax=Anaerotignum sp. MSJ-24 TaxID=2841521 RepID=UPI001C119F36|nr:histidine--tRNA ligase [Anaerotignum sp. MSJ-24]MBU5463867.1 histidine--tRNA ligase [Anaerotignum sp. MSJ-24]
MLTEAPKGTKDIYGSYMEEWQRVEQVMRELCSDFGIKEIRIPIFEHTELYLRGVGETTDIVQKEMYTFKDKADRSITLRPEGTAGVARSFIEHGMYNNPQPTRRFYIGPMFRYENTQKGRQRQFHQFGVEMLGSYSPALDAEAISVVAELLKRLGIKDVELRINSLGCNECRQRYNTALKEYIGSNIDKLCDDCKSRFDKNPLRVLDCKEESCQRIIAEAPVVLDYLDDECKEHFETVKAILDDMGIKYTVDEKIVRGLDYYTRTVFEFVANGIGAQGTVCGGGRYDNLIAECGGQPMGCAGFAVGIERLLLMLEAQNGEFKETNEMDIYIGSIGKEGLVKSQGIAYRMRSEGIRAEGDSVGRSVKAQMKYANKIGAKYSVILGDNEIAEDTANLKNMETGEQEQIKVSELVEIMKKKING